MRYTFKEFQVLLWITNNLIKQPIVFTQLNGQTVLILSIQVNVNHLLVHSLNDKQFFWSTDRARSGATTLGLSGPGSSGYKRLFIFLRPPLTGASPSNCLIFNAGHSFEEFYLSTEIQPKLIGLSKESLY